jgi:GH15 family glucan-1,4-alpha-glucosidase
MIARHYIRIGNREKADEYINWILDNAYDYQLPEHIATKDEFERWAKEYKKAGIMREDREKMIENIRDTELYKKHDLAYSVLPLAWPHAEFIRTWRLYKEKFN